MMERVVLPMEQALQSAASTVGTDADTPLQHLVDTMLAALHATVHDPQTPRVFQVATHQDAGDAFVMESLNNIAADKARAAGNDDHNCNL